MHAKMKFSFKNFLVNVTNLHFPVDLGKFAKEIVNRKLYFLCSGHFCCFFCFNSPSSKVQFIHESQELLKSVKKQFYPA